MTALHARPTIGGSRGSRSVTPGRAASTWTSPVQRCSWSGVHSGSSGPRRPSSATRTAHWRSTGGGAASTTTPLTCSTQRACWCALNSGSSLRSCVQNRSRSASARSKPAVMSRTEPSDGSVSGSCVRSASIAAGRRARRDPSSRRGSATVGLASNGSWAICGRSTSSSVCLRVWNAIAHASRPSSSAPSTSQSRCQVSWYSVVANRSVVGRAEREHREPLTVELEVASVQLELDGRRSIPSTHRLTVDLYRSGSCPATRGKRTRSRRRRCAGSRRTSPAVGARRWTAPLTSADNGMSTFIWFGQLHGGELPDPFRAPLALRVFSNVGEDVTLERERAILDFVAASGYPVPVPLAAVPSGRRTRSGCRGWCSRMCRASRCWPSSPRRRGPRPRGFGSWPRCRPGSTPSPSTECPLPATGDARRPLVREARSGDRRRRERRGPVRSSTRCAVGPTSSAARSRSSVTATSIR